MWESAGTIKLLMEYEGPVRMKRMLSNHSVAHKKLIMKAVGENTPDTAVTTGIEGNCGECTDAGCWSLLGIALAMYSHAWTELK